jgi:hypothetical protein
LRTPDKGEKSHKTLRAVREEGPGSAIGHWGRRVASRVVSEPRLGKFLFVQVAERRNRMPPRRERQSPDREDRDAWRRGRRPENPAGNAEMERQIRDLRARLEDMEATHRRGTDAGEFSDPEIEEEAGHDQEEVTAEDACDREVDHEPSQG